MVVLPSASEGASEQRATTVIQPPAPSQPASHSTTHVRTHTPHTGEAEPTPESPHNSTESSIRLNPAEGPQRVPDGAGQVYGVYTPCPMVPAALARSRRGLRVPGVPRKSTGHPLPDFNYSQRTATAQQQTAVREHKLCIKHNYYFHN